MRRIAPLAAPGLPEASTDGARRAPWLQLDELLAGLPDAPEGVLDFSSGSTQLDLSKQVDLSLDPAAVGRALGYGSPLGRLELRERLCALYAEKHGVVVSPEDLCITDGAAGGLMASLSTLLGPGDELALPEVAFPLYRACAELLGVRLIPVPLNGAQTMDLDALEALVTPGTKAILLNSPSNPFGSTMSRRALERVAELGRTLISDEVYGLLSFNEVAPSVTQVTSDAFVINSFSKAYGAAGLRLGFVLFPASQRRAFCGIKAALNVSTSVVSQMLGERILDCSEQVLRAHLQQLDASRTQLLQESLALGLPLLRPPDAGCFATFRLPPGRGSAQARRELFYNHRLSVASGAAFARVDPGFLRFTFARPAELLSEGLRRLKLFFEA